MHTHQNTRTPLKVLYIITKSNWGGAQRYVFDLARSAARRPSDDTKYDVAVAFGGVGERGAGYGRLKDELARERVRTIPLASLARDIFPLLDVRAFLELLRLFKKERPDVVHLNSSKVGGLGSLAVRLYNLTAGSSKLKAVFTSHGLAFEEARSPLARIAIRFLTWLTFLLSHKIILITEENKARADRMPLVKGKTHLIHNGIGPIDFLDTKTERNELFKRIEKPSHLNNDTRWVGTVSELTQNKGVEYAIRACAELKKTHRNFIFVVVGDGEFHRELTELVKELDLENHVFLLGFVENAARYLKAFDIFTLASLKEGLPYVLLEAGQAGVPAVASNVGGIPDIIEHEQTGFLVEPKDAKALAHSLGRLIDDGSLRTQMGTTLAQGTAARFKIKNMLERTIALYSN